MVRFRVVWSFVGAVVPFALAFAEQPFVRPLPIVTAPDAPMTYRTQTTETPACQDTLAIGIVANTEPGTSRMAVGDTDHDGRNEIILGVGPACKQYQILEEQGNNVYSIEYTGGCLYPSATGDLDGDGKSEIVGQFSGYLQVYESLDAASYPTELVWSSAYISNTLAHLSVGDTDRDGAMEIIYSQDSGGGTANLLIFENAADDSFALVFSSPILGNSATGEKVIADLDGDGLMEVAVCGGSGCLYIFESPANNVWTPVWTESTGMHNAYGAEGGIDADGNGKPELFVMGNQFDSTSTSWTTMIYESDGDNSFIKVATIAYTENYSGLSFNALGNLDGVGGAEYVMDTTFDLRIYQTTGPGQWCLTKVLPDSSLGHHAVQIFDVNQVGQPEVIWVGGPTTLVYEHPLDTSDTGESWRPRYAPLIVRPNPCRSIATLGVPTLETPQATLAVFDVAGRLVERRTLIASDGPLRWPTQHLAAGVYVLRLDNHRGETVAVGRSTVFR